MRAAEEKIDMLLSRNVEEVILKDHLRAALASGKKLRVKFGIDPTSPDLHLGHAVVLRKLREFQDANCAAVLVVGDFTAQIGDPSGRDKTRPVLTAAEVKMNMKDYLKQAGQILDMKKVDIVYNSTWLDKLRSSDLLELLGYISLQQLASREDFQKRISAHLPVQMRELLYPVMQAYDSVAVKADVELGGTDQTFNLMAGRDLMGKLGMKPQDIMTLPLLEGLDGTRKMSKSYGNYIGLADEPDEMFGKVMSLPDSLMLRYFALCTDVSAEEVGEWSKKIGPKDLKMKLAFEIVNLYHGEKKAHDAKNHFDKLFSKKEMPDDLPEFAVKARMMSALDLIMESGATKSKSDARRLIEQGGFEISGKVVKDPQEELKLKDGEVVRIGKKRFFRIKI